MDRLDADEFECLYDEHIDIVFNVARVVCGERFAAGVTEATFLSLWLHPELYDPSRGTLRGHLITETRRSAAIVRLSASLAPPP